MKKFVSQGNLRAQLDRLKDEDRSMATASTWLEKFIKDGLEADFQDFYCSHDLKMQEQYLPATSHMKRESRFRASSAGVCPQRQAYIAFYESDVVMPMDKVTEAPGNWQKRNRLYTGVWLHLKWHVFFDFLNSKGKVKTLEAEKMIYRPELSLSGTIDRLVQFDFCERPFKVILDFKTIRPDDYDRLGPYADPKYAKQMTAYFLLGFPADSGMLLYENKGEQEITLITIPRVEQQIVALEENYKLMNQWVDQMILAHKTRENLDPKYRVKLPILTDQCPGCPFKRQCHNVEHPEILAAVREGIVGDDVF